MFFELELELPLDIDALDDDDAGLDIRQFSSSSFWTSTGNAWNTSGSTLDGSALSLVVLMALLLLEGPIADNGESASEDGFAGVDVER